MVKRFANNKKKGKENKMIPNLDEFRCDKCGQCHELCFCQDQDEANHSKEAEKSCKVQLKFGV